MYTIYLAPPKWNLRECPIQTNKQKRNKQAHDDVYLIIFNHMYGGKVNESLGKVQLIATSQHNNKLLLLLQLNLASLEAVKDGPPGHAVFGVPRKLSYSAANSVAVGGMTPLALRAVEAGWIMEFEFAGMSWTKESAEWLQQALASPGCRVIKANLRAGQGETAAMAQAVADGLIAAGGGCSVKEIRLRDNNLGEAEGVAIAKAIEVNTSVQTIDLGNNNLGAVAGAAILKAMAVNTSVQSIDLRGNELSEAGGVAIAKAIEVNTSVQTIALSNNKLGKVAGAAILKAMEVNTTVTYIDVCDNGIPYETVSAINAAAERNAQSAKEQ